MNTNEEQIRDLISNWATAAKNKDIKGIMAYHVPDLIAFDAPQPLQFKDAESYARHWESFFPMSTGEMIFEVQELKITAGEDVAFSTSLILCGGTEPNGNKFECTSRTTLGFRKIDGQWHFTHEHHSMPMSMDGCGGGEKETPNA
jgi:ketosteroid isomerase-like protein